MVIDMTAIEAPNIRGSYPLGGERLAPAWRAGWALLASAPGYWFSATRVAAVMASVGDSPILPTTSRNLLRQAVKAGLLEQRLGNVGTADDVVVRVQYRIPRNAR